MSNLSLFPSTIPKEEIRNLPLIRFEGRIHLVNSTADLSKCLNTLRKESILGFDTETKPTFNKGEYNHTALIQLATLKNAYIIRIKELGIPDNLKDLLEDRNILKVGISIHDDLKELKACRKFEPGGFLDLNGVAKKLGIKQIGMRSLAGIFLQSRISKSQQTSNWESKELTNGQLSYAATDAWVCSKIYHMLSEKGYLDLV